MIHRFLNELKNLFFPKKTLKLERKIELIPKKEDKHPELGMVFQSGQMNDKKEIPIKGVRDLIPYNLSESERQILRDFNNN